MSSAPADAGQEHDLSGGAGEQLPRLSQRCTKSAHACAAFLWCGPTSPDRVRPPGAAVGNTQPTPARAPSKRGRPSGGGAAKCETCRKKGRPCGSECADWPGHASTTTPATQPAASAADELPPQRERAPRDLHGEAPESSQLRSWAAADGRKRRKLQMEKGGAGSSHGVEDGNGGDARPLYGGDGDGDGGGEGDGDGEADEFVAEREANIDEEGEEGEEGEGGKDAEVESAFEEDGEESSDGDDEEWEDLLQTKEQQLRSFLGLLDPFQLGQLHPDDEKELDLIMRARRVSARRKARALTWALKKVCSFDEPDPLYNPDEASQESTESQIEESLANEDDPAGTPPSGGSVLNSVDRLAAPAGYFGSPIPIGAGLTPEASPSAAAGSSTSHAAPVGRPPALAAAGRQAMEGIKQVSILARSRV